MQGLLQDPIKFNFLDFNLTIVERIAQNPKTEHQALTFCTIFRGSIKVMRFSFLVFCISSEGLKAVMREAIATSVEETSLYRFSTSEK